MTRSSPAASACLPQVAQEFGDLLSELDEAFKRRRLRVTATASTAVRVASTRCSPLPKNETAGMN